MTEPFIAPPGSQQFELLRDFFGNELSEERNAYGFKRGDVIWLYGGNPGLMCAACKRMNMRRIITSSLPPEARKKGGDAFTCLCTGRIIE